MTRWHGVTAPSPRFSVKYTWKPAWDWSLILLVTYYGTPHISVSHNSISSFNKTTHHECLTPLIDVPEVRMKQPANQSNVSLCDEDLAAGSVVLILYVLYNTSCSMLVYLHHFLPRTAAAAQQTNSLYLVCCDFNCSMSSSLLDTQWRICQRAQLKLNKQESSFHQQNHLTHLREGKEKLTCFGFSNVNICRLTPSMQ